MKNGIKPAIVSVQAVLSCIAFAASLGFSEVRSCSLPWQVIAKKIRNGDRFCGKRELPVIKLPPVLNKKLDSLNPNFSYAYQPNEAITFKLSTGTVVTDSLQQTDVALSKWVECSWHEIGEISATIETNEVSIPSGIEAEGIFRLNFTMGTQDGKPNRPEVYTIISNSWKKDIILFYHDLKDEIEFNPDAQLIRSSIAISHLDHSMEVISKTPFLSGKILKLLAEAVWSKKAFDDGRYPDLVIGLNKIRFKRFEGAHVEEFVVFIPDSYESSTTWPVFLHTDTARWAAKDNYYSRSGLIDLWWHTVSHKDLRWKNYRTVMGVIEEKLNIDKNRVYVGGECGNGIAAMALALNYPDQWAECSTSMGNSYRHLAGNALNLPSIFVKGWHNEDPLVGYYDFAVKCFQYHGCRHFKYGKTQNTAQARGAQVPEAVREKNPQRVLYTIESLYNPRAYWVKIDGREDENFPGTMDACVWGQTVLIKTENIDAYSLDLAQAPIDVDRPIEIIENGHSLGFVTNQAFTRRAKKYTGAVCIKNERLHGPVWDAFTDPYVVVWGTGGEDKRFSKISENAARSLAKDGPCLADTNMPEELVDSHNLILVGTAETNLWLSKIHKNIPIQTKEGQLVADGKLYDGHDMGFVLIYPNPLNPERYVAVFSGTSSRAMANICKVYSEMKSIRPVDAAIFEITEGGDIKWNIIEKFNTVWDWHHEWDQVLAVANKKHPKWQWIQWFAKILRKQLEVDVMVCEDPFRFEGPMPIGQITYRDLFNSLRNDWIVTIKLDGKSLRELLMVPFHSISKREVSTPVIDGVSFTNVQQNFKERIIGVNEIENDKTYTVALPEKCVNGQRMGLVIKDYKILGEGYLVPLLKDYLYRTKNFDIDAQLDSLRLEIH